MSNWKMKYQTLSNKELTKLGSEIDTLVPEAQQALNEELEQRNIHPKEIKTYIAETSWKEILNKVKLPNMPRQQLKEELQRGSKIVVFQYCYSIIIMSFKRTSPAFLIKINETPWNLGLKYSLFHLFLVGGVYRGVLFGQYLLFSAI